jgi:hypothetical protein
VGESAVFEGKGKALGYNFNDIDPVLSKESDGSPLLLCIPNVWKDTSKTMGCTLRRQLCGIQWYERNAFRDAEELNISNNDVVHCDPCGHLHRVKRIQAIFEQGYARRVDRSRGFDNTALPYGSVPFRQGSVQGQFDQNPGVA